MTTHYTWVKVTDETMVLEVSYMGYKIQQAETLYSKLVAGLHMQLKEDVSHKGVASAWQTHVGRIYIERSDQTVEEQQKAVMEVIEGL